MQPPTYREIVARLRREGFVKVAQVGSHVKYVKGGLVVIVSGTGGDRPPKGTWSNIQRQAGW
ncbi:MAG: type II toxin-antitoxin system HicA family toxin [Slackia sp.]|nr:type II toxin-antitoxin system HicA family toxin [Slackia sp.]